MADSAVLVLLCRWPWSFPGVPPRGGPGNGRRGACLPAGAPGRVRYGDDYAVERDVDSQSAPHPSSFEQRAPTHFGRRGLLAHWY